jgi:hypothetical protein
MVIAMALVLTVAFVWVQPSLARDMSGVACLFLIACCYGYGVGMQIDSYFDWNRPLTFHTKVISKKAGRAGRGVYAEVRLAPWGPKTGESQASVSVPLFRTLKAGDAVCVEYGRGLFWVPWYRVVACRQQALQASNYALIVDRSRAR